MPRSAHHERGSRSVSEAANVTRKKLGEYLLEAGIITDRQLKDALRRQRQTKEPLGHILARQGMVSEADICRVLHQQLGLPIVELESIAIDEQVIALVREDLAKKYTAIPTELVEAIAKYYHIDASVVEILENIIKNDPIQEIREIVPTEGEENLDELMKISSGPPIVRLANWVITRAVEMRASDIHVEPQDKWVGVRCRVDGLLQDLERLPKWTQGALVSRIKILASLDIAEKRLPQDGSFRVEIDTRRIDLRVSTLPTAHGEKIVIRIVDQERSALHLDSLGLSEGSLVRIKSYGQRPQGIVAVTGPTGSGKSTLLYSLLQHIHSVTKNILTVEDPIEYQIAGINQVQVDEKSKKTFAAILRAMLRQDPDVMMIGEVRDLETAQIAFRASITGHLVLSTVHTNDAPSAVTRLVDLGLQPYMVASSLISVISMRLVRLLCPKCKDQYAPVGEELRILGLTPREGQGVGLFRPVGCEHCNQTGYRGRTGIFEILELDDPLRRLIAAGVAESMIRAAAVESGMTPIGEDGLLKVMSGDTSLEELRRVVFYEEEAARLCPSCRQTAAAEYHFCPHCGHTITAACLKCDRRVDASWEFCPGCGTHRVPSVIAERDDSLIPALDTVPVAPARVSVPPRPQRPPGSPRTPSSQRTPLR